MWNLISTFFCISFQLCSFIWFSLVHWYVFPTETNNETTDISEKRIIHVYWVHVLINVACIGIPLILLTNLIVSQALFDKILLRELLKCIQYQQKLKNKPFLVKFINVILRDSWDSISLWNSLSSSPYFS